MSDNSKIKVTSDGTAEGTVVFLDGKPLGNVRFINFSADAEIGCPTVTLELVGVSVELDVEAKIIQSPFAPIELESEECWVISKRGPKVSLPKDAVTPQEEGDE